MITGKINNAGTGARVKVYFKIGNPQNNKIKINWRALYYTRDFFFAGVEMILFLLLSIVLPRLLPRMESGTFSIFLFILSDLLSIFLFILSDLLSIFLFMLSWEYENRPKEQQAMQIINFFIFLHLMLMKLKHIYQILPCSNKRRSLFVSQTFLLQGKRE